MGVRTGGWGLGPGVGVAFIDSFTQDNFCLKLKALFPIERPTGWEISRIRTLANGLKCKEIYNSTAKREMDETKIKWQNIK